MLTTVPIGIPGRYGALPREPQVSTRSPACGVTVWSTRLRVSDPSPPMSPVPSRKPSSIEVPSRPPTVESRSMISSTVAVVADAAITRPTRPSALTTVRSGTTPSSVPASIVTVREKDWAGPIAIDLRLHDLVAGAVGERARSCRPRRCGSRSPAQRAAGSRSRWLAASSDVLRSRRSEMLRKWSGRSVIGRIARRRGVLDRTEDVGDRVPQRVDRRRRRGVPRVEREDRDTGQHQQADHGPRASGVVAHRGPTSAARRPGPAAAPRTPRRTSRHRGPPSRAGCRRRAPACPSRGAAARRGRAAGLRRRPARRRGP